jgi:hypothetical protein
MPLLGLNAILWRKIEIDCNNTSNGGAGNIAGRSAPICFVNGRPSFSGWRQPARYALADEASADRP